MSPSPEIDALEEIRLLAAVAAGERTAFRQLYARYSTSLFSLAVRLLGDTGAAEEALQDAFVKIWRHASSFDSRKSRPFTWAVTILRRTCIDYLRKNPRLHTDPLLDDGNATSDYATAENIRQATEFREDSERLHVALADISPDQRQALELALFSAMTHVEIAQQLHQPLGTIKTWIRRSLLELRNTLTKTTP